MIYRNRKLFSLLVLVAVFLAVLPAASAFTYNVEPVKNTITKSDSAIFQVTVTNTLEVEDQFSISTRDVNWVLKSDPATKKISALSSASFPVELQPKSALIEENVYVIPVKIKSEKTGSFKEEGQSFVVFLGLAANRSYVPTVTPSVSLEKVVDPREPVSVRVSLRNRNQRDLEDLEVILKGGPELDKSYMTHLLPLEEKVNEILFRIDPSTLPGKRSLVLKLVFENNTISESSTEYEILGFSEMKETSSKKSSLFREENTFLIVNDGNQMGSAEHSFQMNLLRRLFTSFTPEASKVKDAAGNVYYVVSKELGPKESLQVSEVTDYRLLVAFIILIIIATVLYFVFRSPVILYKSGEPIGKKKHEGLSEVKVRLYLKNRANKTVTNIRLTDTIPSIADLKKASHVGSMDPVHTSKGRKGTIARWEFASLEPYEERVIAYKIESKLKLFGGIKIPSAKARFEEKKGKERVVYSNQVNLVQKFEEKDEEK
ncbi:hypothetical protein JW711_02365 [Candidatus Woesearchaeota archaeon]|nr:hypothetical protein [Candidatus Woesearchaeota archaeon]